MIKDLATQDLSPLEGIITLLEVLVDDFIGCTNNITHKHLTQTSRAMINGIYSIFPPPEVTAHSSSNLSLRKSWVKVKEHGPSIKKC